MLLLSFPSRTRTFEIELYQSLPVVLGPYSAFCSSTGTMRRAIKVSRSLLSLTREMVEEDGELFPIDKLRSPLNLMGRLKIFLIRSRGRI